MNSKVHRGSASSLSQDGLNSLEGGVAVRLPGAVHAGLLASSELLPALVTSVVHPVVDGVGARVVGAGVVDHVRVTGASGGGRHGRSVVDTVAGEAAVLEGVVEIHPVTDLEALLAGSLILMG